MSQIINNLINYKKHMNLNQKDDEIFKSKYSFDKRLNESTKIIAKYPDRIPVICERYTKRAPKLDRKKYLCPSDLTIGNFMYIIRQRMKLEPEKALYIFVGGSFVQCSSLLSTVYHHNKDDDGFLYVQYDIESTFG